MSFYSCIFNLVSWFPDTNSERTSFWRYNLLYSLWLHFSSKPERREEKKNFVKNKKKQQRNNELDSNALSQILCYFIPCIYWDIRRRKYVYELCFTYLLCGKTEVWLSSPSQCHAKGSGRVGSSVLHTWQVSPVSDTFAGPEVGNIRIRERIDIGNVSFRKLFRQNLMRSLVCVLWETVLAPQEPVVPCMVPCRSLAGLVSLTATAFLKTGTVHLSLTLLVLFLQQRSHFMHQRPTAASPPLHLCSPRIFWDSGRLSLHFPLKRLLLDIQLWESNGILAMLM